MSVWHHAGGYAAGRSQPQTWLASIVRNRCLDRLRRRDLDTVSLTRDDDEETEIDAARRDRLAGRAADRRRRSRVGARLRPVARRRAEAGDRARVLPGPLARRARAGAARAARHREVVGAARTRAIQAVPREGGVRAMNLSRPDRASRLDALAAEYALGTLSPRARRRLAAIARTDRDGRAGDRGLGGAARCAGPGDPRRDALRRASGRRYPRRASGLPRIPSDRRQPRLVDEPRALARIRVRGLRARVRARCHAARATAPNAPTSGSWRFSPARTRSRCSWRRPTAAAAT